MSKFAQSIEENTERKILEQKLKESEERFRNLFDNASDSIYCYDSKGYFLDVNKTALEMLGCTKEEAIGNNIYRWVSPESLRIAKEHRKTFLSKEMADNLQILEIVCNNGEHRIVEIRTKGIKTDDGTTEVFGMAKDLTENILLKKALNNSNKQKKLLYYLIEGTRGGKTRASILKHLVDRSYNAHQLAKALNLDYKTIRHHLSVLIKNGIITKDSDGYTDLYYLSKNMELDLSEIYREHENNKR